MQENGEAIDSGRFSRADRHQAEFPSNYLKYSIETDPNFDSKGMKIAKKTWAQYKLENELSEEKIKEDFENNIDHLARCFQKQCPPTKRAQQRIWEIENLENPVDRHQMADGDFQYSMYQLVHKNYYISDTEPDPDSSNNISYGNNSSEEDEV